MDLVRLALTCPTRSNNLRRMLSPSRQIPRVLRLRALLSDALA
jgi:hypothetical protein